MRNKILIFICLLIATIVIYVNKQGDTQIGTQAPSETPTEVDNPLGVSIESDTEVRELANPENFTAEEQKQLNKKAEKLSKEEHYDGNVEQLGREKYYDRTSYYDKPIGKIRANGVDETIYAGASELNMRRGVATVEYLEQLDEHTVAIAGHRSPVPNQYFASLVYLGKGDKITIDNYKEGTEKVIASTDYYIDKIYKVKPKDIYVLKDDKNDKRRKLVLITCATYDPETKKYIERYIVEAYTK